MQSPKFCSGNAGNGLSSLRFSCAACPIAGEARATFHVSLTDQAALTGSSQLRSDMSASRPVYSRPHAAKATICLS